MGTKVSYYTITAASLCIVKAGSIPNEACTSTRKEQVATTGGIVDMTVYTGIVSIPDTTTFEVEFIFSPIPNTLPFTFLIGRNLLDHFDAYFLGKKQVLLLKIAEP